MDIALKFGFTAGPYRAAQNVGEGAILKEFFKVVLI